VDLHISRENVKINDKWNEFIYNLFGDIFPALLGPYGSGNEVEGISVISSMIEDRLWLRDDSEKIQVLENPFYRNFLQHAPFPILSNGKISFVECEHALNRDELSVYNCCSLPDELKLLLRVYKGPPLLLNPYNLPVIENEQGNRDDLLTFLLTRRSIRHSALDLRQILINQAVEIDIRYTELMPSNVRAARFKHGLHPLVVVYKPAVVKKEEWAVGANYWGNILLWKKLLDKERVSSYMDAIRKFHGRGLERIEILDEPIVYVDLACPRIMYHLLS
jgi:hypothetical protein